jgi:hypothetical protein
MTILRLDRIPEIVADGAFVLHPTEEHQYYTLASPRLQMARRML